MTGTSTCATIAGTACAAASLLTVTRTSSEPASWRARTWTTVAATSAVSVLVIDWTTMGWQEPTRTAPTETVTVWRRGMVTNLVEDSGGWWRTSTNLDNLPLVRKELEQRQRGVVRDVHALVGGVDGRVLREVVELADDVLVPNVVRRPVELEHEVVGRRSRIHKIPLLVDADKVGVVH